MYWKLQRSPALKLNLYLILNPDPECTQYFDLLPFRVFKCHEVGGWSQLFGLYLTHSLNQTLVSTICTEWKHNEKENTETDVSFFFITGGYRENSLSNLMSATIEQWIEHSAQGLIRGKLLGGELP